MFGKTLKVMVIPADKDDKPIQLAHASMTVPRIGSTVPLALDSSQKVIMHSCEVLDIPQGYDLLIGMDKFFTFGFGIFGLPELGKEVKSSALHPLEDEQEALSPLETPEVEKTPAFKAIKEHFL
jgi:hypothetical protein